MEEHYLNISFLSAGGAAMEKKAYDDMLAYFKTANSSRPSINALAEFVLLPFNFNPLPPNRCRCKSNSNPK
jgi:hypothetical protein